MSGDRYISQNALITEIAKIHGNLSTKNVGQAIWDTPTADVVEVVRCKDCAWYNIFNECCTNTRGIFLCKPDGYCNYGERREE